MFDTSQQPRLLADDILVLAVAMKQLALRAHAAGDIHAGLVLGNMAALLEEVLVGPGRRALAA